MSPFPNDQNNMPTFGQIMSSYMMYCKGKKKWLLCIPEQMYIYTYLYKIWSMRFPALLPHNSDLTIHGQNHSYARSCWCPLKISQALLVCAVWNILPKQPYLSISVDQGHEELGMVMVSRWIITAVSTDWRLFFKAEWISSTVSMRPKITKKL